MFLIFKNIYKKFNTFDLLFILLIIILLYYLFNNIKLIEGKRNKNSKDGPNLGEEKEKCAKFGSKCGSLLSGKMVGPKTQLNNTIGR
tara:strand:- start:796 stop:1056 length:261 start_codon:yes stop_codon:yes gene_type:complete